MPIRMVEDDPSQSNERPSRSSGSRGGGGLLGILPMLLTRFLPFLIKRPKLLVILIGLAAVAYFFFSRSNKNVTEGREDSQIEQIISQFVRGGELDKKAYEKTEIYEALADNKKNPLPEQVSLKAYCPKPLNQGQQGSCVGWASAYAARTILEAKKTGKDPNSLAFSPSYLYNQIALPDCQGAYVKRAMDQMLNDGVAPLKSFAYDDKTCSREPNSYQKSLANSFKIKGFQRLTEESRGKNYEILSIKQNLAKGSPVVIGMMVGGSFMTNMKNRETWIPTSDDYYKSGFGGHAMCVIGYDDYKNGGSFQIMNSWGTDWGKDGFFWIRYTDFREFNREAYGLYPMGDSKLKGGLSFEGSAALELNNGRKKIKLTPVSQNNNGAEDMALAENVFQTVGKITGADKFKIEFTNNKECYNYIFGEEKDGSSYVLFPYTKLHSPYCGITGTRLFPRDYSMQVDQIGNKDRFAVVVTFEPIDFEVMNKKINQLSGSFTSKVRTALGLNNAPVTFKMDQDHIVFHRKKETKDPFYFVVEVNKKTAPINEN